MLCNMANLMNTSQKTFDPSNGDKLRGILGAVFVSLLMVLYQAMCFPHVHNSSGFHLAPDTNPPTRKRHGIRYGSFQMAELMTTFSPSGMMMMMNPFPEAERIEVADPPIARLGFCEERGRCRDVL